MELYHALAENDLMLIQNLTASSGKIFSASYTGISGAVTKYQVFNSNQEKECSFERIRISEFPEQPSRMGALFCFTNEHDAKYANEHWWNNSRKIVRAQLDEHRSYGLFDSRQLDCTKADWDEAARRYFSGELTEKPFIEVVINGMLYIHEWKEIVAQFGKPKPTPTHRFKKLVLNIFGG